MSRGAGGFARAYASWRHADVIDIDTPSTRRCLVADARRCSMQFHPSGLQATMARPATVLLCGLFLCAASAGAQELRRATVWDLKIGQGVEAQPSWREFRSFACGSNGGPPHQQLSGWSDFLRCPPAPNGLHEVYFEYDDEYEYTARANDLPGEVSRWAATTEAGFIVIVSPLFAHAATPTSTRFVTAPPPEHRNDIIEADPKKR